MCASTKNLGSCNRAKRRIHAKKKYIYYQEKSKKKYKHLQRTSCTKDISTYLNYYKHPQYTLWPKKMENNEWYRTINI